MRPFRPKGWCDRCRFIHEPPDPDFEEKLYRRMADQIAREIDEELLRELERMNKEKK
jgi:hypothetical protein